jgi:hypothetical protein
MAGVTSPSPGPRVEGVSHETAQLLHRTRQDALLDLEVATLDMGSREKLTVEQLLLTYAADSVPTQNWADGLAAGPRAVAPDRGRRAATSWEVLD